jgi:hypothetical protein
VNVRHRGNPTKHEGQLGDIEQLGLCLLFQLDAFRPSLDRNALSAVDRSSFRPLLKQIPGQSEPNTQVTEESSVTRTRSIFAFNLLAYKINIYSNG